MSKREMDPPPVSLAQVLDKYWALANLDPETTKGSITGQLKALDALCVELSAATGTQPKTARPDVYRAAWLDD